MSFSDRFTRIRRRKSCGFLQGKSTLELPLTRGGGGGGGYDKARLPPLSVRARGESNRAFLSRSVGSQPPLCQMMPPVFPFVRSVRCPYPSTPSHGSAGKMKVKQIRLSGR